MTYYEPLPGDDAASLSAQRARLLAGDLEHVDRPRPAPPSPPCTPSIAREIAHIARDPVGPRDDPPRPRPPVRRRPRQTARAPIARVRPCAADTAGLPLFEEAFYAGVRAAEAALDALGRPAPTLVET
jgi:hypothetical protein